MNVCHIIVAAGSGCRFGATLPKQFCLMGERPVVMETISRMRRFGGEDADILLVISADMEGLWQELCESHSFVSPPTVHGGATRAESVRNALAHPLARKADIITVHDAARPLLTQRLMDAVMALRPGSHGNIPVVKVTDSLRMVGKDGSVAVDRSEFRAVQTPQAFRGEMLRKAYEQPLSPAFTDDASVMEAAGFSRLDLVEGDSCNIKITNPGDIDIALLYLNNIS